MNWKTGGVHCPLCSDYIKRDGKRFCKYYDRYIYAVNIKWCRKHDVV